MALAVPRNSMTAGVISFGMGKRCRFTMLQDVALARNAVYSMRSDLVDRLVAAWSAASYNEEVALAHYTVAIGQAYEDPGIGQRAADVVAPN